MQNVAEYWVKHQDDRRIAFQRLDQIINGFLIFDELDYSRFGVDYSISLLKFDHQSFVSSALVEILACEHRRRPVLSWVRLNMLSSFGGTFPAMSL